MKLISEWLLSQFLERTGREKYYLKSFYVVRSNFKRKQINKFLSPYKYGYLFGI